MGSGAISSLPPGWRWARLGDVLRLRKDVLHPTRGLHGHAAFVGLEHIESGTGRRAGKLELDLSMLTGRKPLFSEGDIVYGYLRPYLNKVWIAEFSGLCSVDQYVYSPDDALADREYLAWFMRSPSFLRRAPIKTTPGQLPRIRTDEVARVPIALPPLSHQARIAAEIRDSMSLVERAQAAAEAQLGATTTMVDAFARSIFRGSAREHWPRRQLAAFADVAGGLQKTPDRAPGKNAVPYLTVRNVQRGSLDLSHIEEFEVTPTELSRLRLLDGDVLIVEGNGSAEQIGRNALFTAQGVDWIHQNHLIRVRLRRDTALPEFVSVFLNSEEGRSQMLQKARTTSGLYSLSVGKVGELEVPLPSMDEQRVLAKSLQAQRAMVDRARLAMQDEISAIRALPGALLRRAFSDEV